MRLNVASTASTMDWMVKLIDVYVPGPPEPYFSSALSEGGKQGSWVAVSTMHKSDCTCPLLS